MVFGLDRTVAQDSAKLSPPGTFISMPRMSHWLLNPAVMLSPRNSTLCCGAAAAGPSAGSRRAVVSPLKPWKVM